MVSHVSGNGTCSFPRSWTLLYSELLTSCQSFRVDTVKTWPTQDSARRCSRQTDIVVFECSINKNELHSFRQLRGAFVRGSISNRRCVKNSDVSIVAFLQQSSITQAFALRRQRRNFSDRLLQGNKFFIANVAAEKAWHAPECAWVGMLLVEGTVE